MTVQEFYASIGASSEEVIKRFGGSSAMLERFLKKFLDDPTYSKLEAAFASGDRDEIFRAAHTLKGLAGNFDFTELHRLAAKIVEEYRASNDSAIPPLYEELKKVYADIIDALHKFLG